MIQTVYKLTIIAVYEIIAVNVITEEITFSNLIGNFKFLGSGDGVENWTQNSSNKSFDVGRLCVTSFVLMLYEAEKNNNIELP